MVHFAWHLTASSKSPGPIRILLVFSNCRFLPIKGTTDISDIKIFVKYRQTLYWQIPTPKNYELRQSKVLLEIDVSWAHIVQQKILLKLTAYNRYHIVDQHKPQYLKCIYRKPVWVLEIFGRYLYHQQATSISIQHCCRVYQGVLCGNSLGVLIKNWQ